MSQSWGGLSVSIAKDREWGSYLPGCTAFMFCFMWFETFRSLYEIGHISGKPGLGLRFAPLNQWYCYVYVCKFILFWCAHIRQAGHFSGSSAVCFIWKVFWKGLYKGVAVETVKDGASGSSTKLWCWPEDIPKEWVVFLGSHSHHLRMDVEKLPIFNASRHLAEHQYYQVRRIWYITIETWIWYWNIDTYCHWVWEVQPAWLEEASVTAVSIWVWARSIWPSGMDPTAILPPHLHSSNKWETFNWLSSGWA